MILIADLNQALVPLVELLGLFNLPNPEKDDIQGAVKVDVVLFVCCEREVVEVI